MRCILRVLTQEDCKAARAYLNLKAGDLAEISGVSIDTLRSFESGRSKTLSASNQAAIVHAFEAQGIQCLDTGKAAAGPGVALRTGDGE